MVVYLHNNILLHAQKNFVSASLLPCEGFPQPIAHRGDIESCGICTCTYQKVFKTSNIVSHKTLEAKCLECFFLGRTFHCSRWRGIGDQGQGRYWKVSRITKGPFGKRSLERLLGICFGKKAGRWQERKRKRTRVR